MRVKNKLDPFHLYILKSWVNVRGAESRGPWLVTSYARRPQKDKNKLPKAGSTTGASSLALQARRSLVCW